MRLFLLPLTLLVIVGIFLLRRLVRDRVRRAGAGSARIVIIVKDQEPWVEGFIRRLFRCINNTPRLEVVVVDDGSRDSTREILSRLQRTYPFNLIAVAEGANAGTVILLTEAVGSLTGARCFDARGLKGKDFLGTPLFWNLTDCNGGISRVLSK